MDERQLGGVFGLLAASEVVQAIAVDAVVKALVEELRVSVGRGRPCDGPIGATYRRDCGQRPPLLGESKRSDTLTLRHKARSIKLYGRFWATIIRRIDVLRLTELLQELPRTRTRLLDNLG